MIVSQIAAQRPRRAPARQATESHIVLNSRPFPSWARPGAKAADQAAAAAFAAGAGLALLDAILGQEPPFAGALRHRLALRAAAASAKILRLREDQGALRDAEHLAVSDDPGRAGRLHRWWRRLASDDARLDPERFYAVDQGLDLLDRAELSALIGEFEQVLAGSADPVSAAAEAHALAGELGRRAETLLALQPKLRAKGACRVVALLLADDCVSPARAAKSCALSDRAARRLFDRLVDQGAVRELSGRPAFRLYGL